MSNDNSDIIGVLRTVSQNQTKLISLADQKASILLALVVVLLTAFLLRTTFLKGQAMVMLLPVYVFFAMESIACILSFMVIVPKGAASRKSGGVADEVNPLFFGCFGKYSQEEFLAYLRGNLQNNQQAREVLGKDIYQAGQILKRKYMMLKLAYSSAIAGIVLPMLLMFFMVKTY